MREVEYDYTTKVNSTAVDTIYYNNKTKELYVEFPGGRLAGYRNVSVNDVYRFVEAPSVGSHYAHYIRGKFSGINTADVVLKSVKAKAPAGVVADNSGWGSGSVSTGSFHSTPKGKFSVTFVVTQTVEVPADTMEQAISSVRQGNPSAEVLEVKKV